MQGILVEAASIQTILKKALPIKTWQHKLLSQWPQIVGELHEQMRIEKIKQDALIIGVYDPHWMHELFMLAPTILETISHALGKNYISHIRFVCASKKEPLRKKNAQTTPKPRQLAELAPRHEQVLSRVQNEDLKTALRSFFSNCVTK